MFEGRQEDLWNNKAFLLYDIFASQASDSCGKDERKQIKGFAKRTIYDEHGHAVIKHFHYMTNMQGRRQRGGRGGNNNFEKNKINKY